MTARTKAFGWIALCVALVAFFLWQRTRIAKLHEANGDLRARLAEVQHGPIDEQTKVAAVPSPDPELLRLRAEVAELRRRQTALALSNSTARSTNVPALNEADELPFEIREQQSTRVLMRLVLAMLMIVADREEQKASGRFEIVDANGVLTADIRRECEKLLKESEETSAVDLDKALSDVEFLITDAADLAKLHPNTIVARSVAMKMPYGKWRRIYAFADGSAHRRVHDTPDEIWQAPPQ